MILFRHLPDQVPDALLDLGTAHLPGSRFPSPVPAEPGPVPTEDGVRLNDEQYRFPILPYPRQPDPEPAVGSAKLRAFHAPLQYQQLLAKGQILRRQSRPRRHHPSDQPNHKPKHKHGGLFSERISFTIHVHPFYISPWNRERTEYSSPTGREPGHIAQRDCRLEPPPGCHLSPAYRADRRSRPSRSPGRSVR